MKYVLNRETFQEDYVKLLAKRLIADTYSSLETEVIYTHGHSWTS